MILFNQITNFIAMWDDKTASRFIDFAHSPIFNKNSALSVLATKLLQYKQILLSKEWDEDMFWSRAFTKEAIPAHKRYRLLTKLHTLIEDFWVVHHTLTHPYHRKEAIINTYIDFQLHDWAKFEINQLEQSLQQSDIHNTLFLQYKLKVEKMKVTHAWHFQQRGKVAHDIFHPLIHALDDYYFIYRLELCTYLQYIQSMQQYEGIQHDSSFIENTLSMIEQNDNVWRSVHIQVYYYLVKMFHYSTDYCTNILEIIQQYEDEFYKDELTNIFALLRGFYTFKAQKGDENALNTILTLYRISFEKKWVYNSNGEIMPSFFLNYLFFNIDQGQDVHALTPFITKYSPQLYAQNRKNTILIADALCAFVMRDFNTVLYKIRIAKMPDVIINLKVRRLEMKTYFEMGEMENALHYLNAFRVFIQRCEGLQYDIVQANRNFASEFKRLIDHPKCDTDASCEAKKRIKDLDFLVEYWWLKEKWRF